MSADALCSALLAFGLKPSSRTKSVMAMRLVRARRAAAASEQRSITSVATHSSSSSSLLLPPRFDTERAGNWGGSALEACRLCEGDIAPPRRSFCSDECVHFHLLRTSGSHVRKALALRDQKRCVQCGVDAGAAYLAAVKAVKAVKAVRAVKAAVSSAETSAVVPSAAASSAGAEYASGTLAADSTVASSSAAVGTRRAEEALQSTAEEALGKAVAGTPFEGYARLRPAGTRRRGGIRPAKVIEGSFWQADHEVAVHEGGGCCGISNLRTLCTRCHAQVTAAQAKRRAEDRRLRLSASSGTDTSRTLSRSIVGHSTTESVESRSSSEAGEGGSAPAVAAGLAEGTSAESAIILIDDEGEGEQEGDDEDDESGSNDEDMSASDDDDFRVTSHLRAGDAQGEQRAARVSALSLLQPARSLETVQQREVIYLSSDGECVD